MANKHLFKTRTPLPNTDTVNGAGGVAYKRTPKQALAQFVATGCLNDTFYASAQSQLDEVASFAQSVDGAFLAKAAIYGRQRAHMKDLPALLVALISVKAPEHLEVAFERVIDSPRMLRTFVQIMRSGAVGRRSLGSRPKRLIRRWLENRSDDALFRASVGNSPSIADIVKMVHPKPQTPSRQALYGHLIGRPVDADNLPELVRQFEAWKQDPTGAPPDVPFQMLTAFDLSTEQWADIARRAPWQMTRMNLSTFLRHGVFKLPGMTTMIAERLRNQQLVERSRVLPYQLLMAYKAAGDNVPHQVREALQDAMEHSLRNVPRIDGKVFVFPDVSGSMHMSITGYRPGATSAVRCVDVAGLVAAALLRTNPQATVMPFESRVVSVRLEAHHTVMHNAQKLASLNAGGTNCSAPLRQLNERKAKGDLLIYVSDNESWIDSRRYGRGPTAMLEQWTLFKRRNPKARLVCIDLVPGSTTQAKERKDIWNVGGFSDDVFHLLAQIGRGEASVDHWVREIEKVELERAAA